MKLLKLITIFFIFYFIRRFIQMVKVLQTTPEAPVKNPESVKKDFIDADYKVIN